MRSDCKVAAALLRPHVSYGSACPSPCPARAHSLRSALTQTERSLPVSPPALSCELADGAAVAPWIQGWQRSTLSKPMNMNAIRLQPCSMGPMSPLLLCEGAWQASCPWISNDGREDCRCTKAAYHWAPKQLKQRSIARWHSGKLPNAYQGSWIRGGRWGCNHISKASASALQSRHCHHPKPLNHSPGHGSRNSGCPACRRRPGGGAVQGLHGDADQAAQEAQPSTGKAVPWHGRGPNPVHRTCGSAQGRLKGPRGQQGGAGAGGSTASSASAA